MSPIFWLILWALWYEVFCHHHLILIMNKSKFAVSVFSNWTYFIVSIAIAFVIYPMMVHNLGNEAYAIYVLIISMTGYFSVLDFGFNGAIVKYISQYSAQGKYKKASEIYTAAFILFASIALCIVVFASIFALFFKDLMDIDSFSRNYLYVVFFTISLDVALRLIFGTNSATLTGMQNYLELNIIGISLLLIRTSIVVYLLQNGYSLLSLALVQLSMGLLAISAEFYLVRNKYSYLKFKPSLIHRGLYSKLFGYTIFSFMISVAQKILFFTDSIVIGSLLQIEMVTFYAIANDIVNYLTSLIWAAIAVLIPIVSSNDATGDKETKKRLYVVGTKYTLILCSPILLVLFVVGDDFIRLWMGEEYAGTSGSVLSILLVGYLFGLSQLIAQAILKGVGRHKIIAYIMCFEAALNLVLSIYLAPIYGIKGVAYGTTIPVLIASIFLIPYFTCKDMNISLSKYILESYVHPLLAFLVPLAIALYLDIQVHSYLELILLCTVVMLAYALYTLIFHLESNHRKWVLETMRITAR